MPHFAVWFRHEDYQRIRQIMDDRDKFPPEFDAWETRAKGQMEEAKRHGLVITPVILEPDEFLAFCKTENMTPRGEARATPQHRNAQPGLGTDFGRTHASRRRGTPSSVCCRRSPSTCPLPCQKSSRFVLHCERGDSLFRSQRRKLVHHRHITTRPRWLRELEGLRSRLNLEGGSHAR